MNHWEEVWGKRSGFEDIPIQERCVSPYHEPPTLLYIPPGKQYRHVCPSCRKETLLRPPFIYMRSS